MRRSGPGTWALDRPWKEPPFKGAVPAVDVLKR